MHSYQAMNRNQKMLSQSKPLFRSQCTEIEVEIIIKIYASIAATPGTLCLR